MKWSKWPWGWILAMVYVAVVPLVFGMLAFWPQMPAIVHHLSGQTAAAWAQAAGGIGAITAAFLIARRDHQEALRRDRRKQRSLLNVAATVGDQGFSAVVVFHKLIRDSAQVDLLRNKPIIQTTDFKDIAESIDGLPLHEIDEVDVVFKLRVLKMLMRYADASQAYIIEEIRLGNVVEHFRVVEWRERRTLVEAIKQDLVAHRDRLTI